MRLSRGTASFLVLVVPTGLAACGARVVVDGQSGSAGTSNGGGGSTSTISSSAVTTSTSSSGAVGACTQGSDPAQFDDPGLHPLLTNCALQNVGDSAAQAACIQAAVGVSTGCAACLNEDVLCAIADCLPQCEPPNTASEACVLCCAANCNGAFLACSGLPAAPASQSCSGVLGGGPAATPLTLGLRGGEFNTPAEGAAYAALVACACTTRTAGGGCADLCDDTQSGSNVPDYCNGAGAQAQCQGCLQTNCAAALQTCAAN